MVKKHLSAQNFDQTDPDGPFGAAGQILAVLEIGQRNRFGNANCGLNGTARKDIPGVGTHSDVTVISDCPAGS